MHAHQPPQGEFSRRLSLVASMCIHLGVPLDTVLIELRQQLGKEIDARQGLSVSEASLLSDVSKKSISNWLRDSRQERSEPGNAVFSKIELLGQLVAFCRDQPRAIPETQRRADASGWRVDPFYPSREFGRCVREPFPSQRHGESFFV